LNKKEIMPPKVHTTVPCTLNIAPFLDAHLGNVRAFVTFYNNFVVLEQCFGKIGVQL